MALTGKSGDNLVRLAGGVSTAADCTQESRGVRVFHIFAGGSHVRLPSEARLHTERRTADACGWSHEAGCEWHGSCAADAGVSLVQRTVRFEPVYVQQKLREENGKKIYGSAVRTVRVYMRVCMGGRSGAERGGSTT